MIDLATGSQPVANEPGDVVAVFNGELYNFRELRAELAAAGHDGPRHRRHAGASRTCTRSTAPSSLERLSGMFAIALWDAARERLVLARDRVGKKPLLWTRLPDGTLAFASELKALLRLPGRARARSTRPRSTPTSRSSTSPAERALRGIEKLPPGHVLVAEDGACGSSPTGRSSRAPATHADEEWLERVRETVGAAVRRRLVADVPLGALLSGGIDSSVVVARAGAGVDGPVRTFTVGFGDAALRRAGVRARRRRAVRHRARGDRRRAGRRRSCCRGSPQAFDEPLGDEAALPLLLVCELARRHVTVALTGDGGDEAFAGYERYAAMRLAGRLARPGCGPAARGAPLGRAGTSRARARTGRHGCSRSRRRRRRRATGG